MAIRTFSAGLQTPVLCCDHLGFLLMWSLVDFVTYIIYRYRHNNRIRGSVTVIRPLQIENHSSCNIRVCDIVLVKIDKRVIIQEYFNCSLNIIRRK